MKRFANAQAWLAVGLLWVVALLNYLDRLMITTLREPLKADIAMTDAQFGLLTSVFLWVYGAFSPLGGYLADRFSRRWVIIASLGIWSGVTWLTGQMSHFESLLLARAAMGLSEACYLPAALALISDFHTGRTRSLATGLHMSGVYAGAALGGLGAVIAEHTSWRHGFSIFGLCGVAYAVVMFLFLPDSETAARAAARTDQTPSDKVAGGQALEGETLPSRVPENRSRGATLIQALTALLGEKAFLLLLVANALVGVANWGIYGWLPTFLRERFKLGLGEAGMTATGYIQLASFVGVLLGGFWADRWSRARASARTLVPAIGFLVAAPCLFFGLGAAGIAIAVAGLAAYGLARGFYDANLMPAARTVVDERLSATAYGVLNLVSVFMGGVMIYAGGWLKDVQVDLGVIFQFSAVGLFAVGVVLTLIRGR